MTRDLIEKLLTKNTNYFEILLKVSQLNLCLYVFVT